MTTGQVAGLRLRALPIQLIPIPSAVILRRGGTEVRIGGERALEAVEKVLAAVSGGGATAADVCEQFAEPDRPAIKHLLGELCTRRLLVPVDLLTETVPGADILTPAGDGRLDIFYWHFGQRGADVVRSLSSRRIVMVGVNAVSLRLVYTLAAIGAINVEVIDYPPLRNVDLVASGPDARLSDAAVVRPEWLDRSRADDLHCVIATSDFGVSEGLRLWNRFCVGRHIPFLPVVQHDLVGTVGPLVMPGETPCYECLRARESSHVDDPTAHRAAEQTATEGQRFAAFHPSAVTVLAELAGVELSKWFGGGQPPTRQVGTLVEVNVAEPYVVVRRVLRVPRCPVCSPSNVHSAGAVSDSAFDPR